MSAVRDFEQAFASHVGAKYCVAVTNGTVSLEAALVAIGVRRGDRVVTTPLTMSATSLAILKMGATPVYADVDPDTWLIEEGGIAVSLYGLHAGLCDIDDAAQTLRPHNKKASFTSYSFQKSKHLNLSEGGALTTDDPELARRARWYTSLGYDLSPDSSKIDPAKIKSPEYIRHIDLIPGAVPTNARMNDVTAQQGLAAMDNIDNKIIFRRQAGWLYSDAIKGCEWIQAQHTPRGWGHDMWSFAVALKDKSLWHPFTEAIVRNGGEMPYGAWRLTYDEPAFRHLRPNYQPMIGETWPPDVFSRGICPVAEDIQPRLVQFQTNNLESAERNARAVRKAIEELS